MERTSTRTQSPSFVPAGAALSQTRPGEEIPPPVRPAIRGTDLVDSAIDIALVAVLLLVVFSG